MAEVLAASLAFPAVIFAVILGVALLYWLFVVLGALDLDLLGGAEGDVVPELDGVAKGALEGAAKGAAEGLTDVDGAEGHGGVGALFASLELHRAPATVVLTLLAAFAWLVSVLATMTVQPLWDGWGLPRWLLGLAVLAVALAVALPLTSLSVRPLGPLFATRKAQSRTDLVGRVCVISTGRVDGRFGQATLEDGGAGLILDVRCEAPGALRQGDRALLVSWDPEKEVFSVEPLDALLDGRAQGGQRGDADALSAEPGPDGGGAEAPEAGEPAVERARRSG